MKNTVFTGAGVAIITPMNADGSINWDEFGRIIDFQIENGTDAIIVCGTTGESATMTDDEHVEAIRYCVNRVNKRVPIIFDSGIRNGTHIFKAIAAGADVVAIGRPVIYALSIGGWKGVVSLFDYLKQDLSRVMTLAGAQTVEDIKNIELRPKCILVRCTEL